MVVPADTDVNQCLMIFQQGCYQLLDPPTKYCNCFIFLGRVTVMHVLYYVSSILELA